MINMKNVNKFAEIFAAIMSFDSDTLNNINDNSSNAIILKNGNTIVNCFHNKYLKALFVKDGTLDIEFFAESDNVVEVDVENQQEERIYELSIYTVPTLHLFIDTKSWNRGVYSINIMFNSLITFNVLIC